MTEPQVSPAHYATLAYDTQARWASYWHQIDEVLRVRPRSCLAIGVGSGVVHTRLRERGLNVITVDIDEALEPDRVGDVRALPAADHEFDVVLCAQVLEHVPFGDVGVALSEIARVARERAVVTVPTFGRTIELSFRVPPFRRVSWVGSIPSRHAFSFDGQHYWELGARNATHSAFVAELRERFAVHCAYRVPGNPYHSLFVLEPKRNG